ncbi:MAG TPA: hypothetical protein VFQ53_28935 [Kofleriaceae bacterium]|nr:hypothetical protein [Kofleriaceae bacterium]
MRDRAEFVRFVVPAKVHDESQTAIGLVAFAYELLDAGDPANEAALRGHLRWLEQNLRVPDRFNRETPTR